MQPRSSVLMAAIALAATAPAASSQAAPASPAAQTPAPLEVGAMAPDFALRGGTRFGVLRDPVRLSDFHGKTVILAFFFRSRTRG